VASSAAPDVDLEIAVTKRRNACADDGPANSLAVGRRVDHVDSARAFDR
jgi:hypothetical protein